MPKEETHFPTLELRWFQKKAPVSGPLYHPRELQQLWKDRLGHLPEQWRTIPTVKDS